MRKAKKLLRGKRSVLGEKESAIKRKLFTSGSL